MDDTLTADNKALALALGALIRDHKGIDVVVMDLRPLNIWTDFFIIATVSSHTHLQGLRRAVKEFAGLRGIDIPGRSRRLSSGDEWNLIDIGTIVVHLMTAKTRGFYELERLWGAAEILSLSEAR
ncbi:MAG: ribosome silencing factor [Spirochaetaceae bacterium]|jgi:ribosome-associated protein|nr:ribosome silencing factor [Spirochaetaceae bacterium]